MDDEPTTTGVTVVDPDALRSLLDATGGDVGFVAELVEQFRHDGRAHVAAMRQATAEGDRALLVRAAHTLKSAAATFGATTLAESCRRLEVDARTGGIIDGPSVAAGIDAQLEEVVVLLVQWVGDDTGAS